MKDKISHFSENTHDFSGLIRIAYLPILTKRANQASVGGFFTRPQKGLEKALLALKAEYESKESVTTAELTAFLPALVQIYNHDEKMYKTIKQEIEAAQRHYIHQEQHDIMKLMSEEQKFSDVFNEIESRVQRARQETAQEPPFEQAKHFFKAINWILQKQYGSHEQKRNAFIEQNAVLQAYITMQTKYPFTLRYPLSETKQHVSSAVLKHILLPFMETAGSKGKGEKIEADRLSALLKPFYHQILQAKTKKALRLPLCNMKEILTQQPANDDVNMLNELQGFYLSKKEGQDALERILNNIDELIHYIDTVDLYHPAGLFRDERYDIARPNLANKLLDGQENKGELPVVDIIQGERKRRVKKEKNSHDIEDDAFALWVQQCCKTLNYKKGQRIDNTKFGIDTGDGHRFVLSKTAQGLRIQPDQTNNNDADLCQHVSDIVQQSAKERPVKAIIRNGSDTQRFELFKHFVEQGIYVESWSKKTTNISEEQAEQLEQLERKNQQNEDHFYNIDAAEKNEDEEVVRKDNEGQGLRRK